MRFILIGLVLAVAAGASFVLFWPAPQSEVCSQAARMTAPSGRDVTLCDVLYEVQPDSSSWAVVRVVDEALPPPGVEMVTNDHDWACATWGLPALEREPRPIRIVVQIMERPFERGEPAPGLRQRIEAYSIENDICQWELF